MSRGKRLRLERATVDDARALAELHTSVAQHLTQEYGQGPWSGESSEKGVLSAMRRTKVFVARDRKKIVATLRLTTKKPWAIDPKYFSKSHKPIYLLAMAVSPARQRQGLGRKCLEEAKRIAKAWPANAIRLDAYDADGGAGEFYARCGYTEVGRASYRNTPLIYYEFFLT